MKFDLTSLKKASLYFERVTYTTLTFTLPQAYSKYALTYATLSLEVEKNMPTPQCSFE